MVTLATTLCVLCSCGAGLGAAVFGCILSWADHIKRKNGGVHTRRSHIVAIGGVIGSTLFGFSSLVGLYFGPVTLVVVIRAGSLLPANAFFSQMFGLRPLTRDDYLGTVVTISGVVCFSIFGGSPAEAPSEAEFVEMMEWSGAILCNILLLLILVAFLSVLALDGLPPSGQTLAVTNVGGVSSAFMDLAAKGWSAALARGADNAGYSMLFWASLALNVVFLVSMRVSMIYGCKRCDVLLFVPLNTVLNIFYSVLAGMVVLQEYKEVNSWPGLLAASTSVLGGVVMLVSGPASRDEDEDEAENSEQKLERWSSEGAQSDIEAFVPRRSTTVMRSPVASPQHQELVATPPSHTLRGRGYSSPIAADTDEDPVDNGLDELLSVEPQPSKGYFSTIAHGLRPEIVRMNAVHKEAARANKRWQRVRWQLLHMVWEDGAAATLGQETPLRARTLLSGSIEESSGPEDSEADDMGSESSVTSRDES